MLISKKIRLEVSPRDAATLEFMQGKSRGLYNWWVMRLRDGEKWPGWQEAKKTLQQSKAHDPELRFVYGKLLQEVFFRLDSAMQAFFRRVKNGKSPDSRGCDHGIAFSRSSTRPCISRWKVCLSGFRQEVKERTSGTPKCLSN